MGQAQGVGAGARQADGLRRAARALGRGGGRVVPQAHGDADDVVPGVAQQHGGDGAVDAAAHGHGHPAGRPREPGGAEAVRVPRLEGAGDGVLDDLRAVAPRRPQPAEVGVEQARREAEGVVERGAVEAGAGGAGGGRGRAAAERLEPRLAHAAAGYAKRDPHQVAARRAPGLADGVRAGEGTGAPWGRQMAHGLGRVGRHRGRLAPQPAAPSVGPAVPFRLVT